MTMLRKVVPAPLWSAALLVFWVVLTRDVGPGQLLFGLGLALVVPPVTAVLQVTRVRIRRPLVIAKYVLAVGYDVVHANLEVARGVITWRRRQPQFRFVVIPIELRNPVGLAVLAMVTTVVPGTVWSELAVDGSALLLHAWDVPDERAFIIRYKSRYEQPLREIFE